LTLNAQFARLVSLQFDSIKFTDDNNTMMAGYLQTTRIYSQGLGLVFLAVLFVSANNPALAVDCTCRYYGQSYGLGTEICFKTPTGYRMAKCNLVLNNTSWQIGNRSCAAISIPHDFEQNFREIAQRLFAQQQ